MRWVDVGEACVLYVYFSLCAFIGWGKGVLYRLLNCFIEKPLIILL